jgi:predicted lipase
MQTGYSQLSQDVQSLLAIYPDYYITFMGHSSGACNFGIILALAALHVLVATGKGGYLEDYPNSKISIIGIAAPRVGNQAFADHISSSGFRRTIRIANKGDILTILPPAWFLII